MGLKKKIGILGGGPSGLFMYKRLIESGIKNLEIHIFERKDYLGAGMPYSKEGANDEHITNVSDNEIPEIFNSIADWVHTAPESLLTRFRIVPEKFNEYKVLPRLFFGAYLSSQFDLLCEQADCTGVITKVHLETQIVDLIDDPQGNTVRVKIGGGETYIFDQVIICTGHNWPRKLEGKIRGYYDSPYPPAKLVQRLNHPVAVMGAGLTAIDALRTLARSNGEFVDEGGKTAFNLHPESAEFRIVMHSRNGLLPAVRFHLEDSHLGKDGLLTKDELDCHRRDNDGFISLDFLFEKNFKEKFIDKDPAFYRQVKDMTLETFVETMMNRREKRDPFELFKLEYEEAEKSIRREESIHWKEMLAVLSFAMNYPAKYLSAEDMQRLQRSLMPLISIVIAFVPQSSCRDLMALHDAGVLSLISVGEESEVLPLDSGGVTYRYTDDQGKKVEQYFDTFIDCTGQPRLSFDDFPFQSLIKDRTLSPATLRFRSQQCGESAVEKGNELAGRDDNGQYFLNVPGIGINDNFQPITEQGHANDRIYIMAVPYIGGYNPDYSGIDFSEAASQTIVKSILSPMHEDLKNQKVNTEN